MNNVCMKFRNAGPNPTLVIDRTRKYDRWTDMCKAIYPLFFEGGHNESHTRPSFDNLAADPKSANFTCPWQSSNTFSGFKSLKIEK